ncbi:MAG: hypothetical protein HRU17_21955 [Polyangiaceae bacterium]|nr:hypothetical protein [Polyangiaceae bacterium]
MRAVRPCTQAQDRWTLELGAGVGQRRQQHFGLGTLRLMTPSRWELELSGESEASPTSSGSGRAGLAFRLFETGSLLTRVSIGAQGFADSPAPQLGWYSAAGLSWNPAGPILVRVHGSAGAGGGETTRGLSADLGLVSGPLAIHAGYGYDERGAAGAGGVRAAVSVWF